MMSRTRWIDRIAQWCGFSPASVRTRARTPLDDFLSSTQVDSHDFDALDSKLKEDGLTRAQVSAFCRCFARGVQYVHQRFGMLPERILISNGEARTPRYNIDTKSIIIPYRFVAICIKLGTLRQSKTEPLLLTWQEMAIMDGVEEAYHHYDITAHPGKYDLTKIGRPDGTSAYDDTPLEAAAKEVVREALRDFNLLNRPTATHKVEAADLSWLASARNTNRSWVQKVKNGPWISHSRR